MKSILFAGLMAPALVFANSISGITTVCSGTKNNRTYRLAVATNSKTQGGYRLTIQTSGHYPTVTSDLGTAPLLEESDGVLTVSLEPKAYMFDALGMDIPIFLEESDAREPKKLIIDTRTAGDITAQLPHVALKCK